jgi:hypothetical protein
MGDPEKTTTLAIYASDLPWFQGWQREICRRRARWMNMPEAVRELIAELKLQQEEGA